MNGARVRKLIPNYIAMGAAYEFIESFKTDVYIVFYDIEVIDVDYSFKVGANAEYALNEAVSFFGKVQYCKEELDVEARMKVRF